MTGLRSRITAIVPRLVKEKLVTALRLQGLEQISVVSARSPILRERKGLALLLGESALASAPVDMISFFVPLDCERDALHFIISEGELNIPGRGSAYSERVSVVEQHPDCDADARISFKGERSSLKLFENLTAISCVVQRGRADEMAKIMLSRGIVPTITFGEGTGIRDRLGLLRITIPKEKEILHVVVGRYDTDFVLETMVTAGRLDLPGRGFISQSEVACGIINAKSIAGSSGHAASIEQIVSVVDKLEGGMEWRRDQAMVSSRRSYVSGVDVYLYTNEGRGLDIAKKVMEAGVSGATISQTTLLQPENQERVSRARELCKMMIPSEIAPKVIEACRQANAFDHESQGLYLTIPVAKAYTYMGKT